MLVGLRSVVGAVAARAAQRGFATSARTFASPLPPPMRGAGRASFVLRAVAVLSGGACVAWLATSADARGAVLTTVFGDAKPPVRSTGTDAKPPPPAVALKPNEVVVTDVHTKLPVEVAKTTYAPDVPPPITRSHPVRLIVNMNTTAEDLQVSPRHKYPMWTFDGHVPGPFIRARVGDVVEVHYENKDETGIGHNIDFHAFTGPGGGAPALYAEPGETKAAAFKLLYPGLYVYHCAAGPVPVHVANGMYGLILVEPEKGLPKVDKEYYVMQSEIYAELPEHGSDLLIPSYADGVAENPLYVLLNGREGALTESPLLAKQGDKVRIYFGNGGPNLVSSFHVIGAVFDKVYREGSLMDAPSRGVHVTTVPAGGSCVVEFDVPVPGNYTLLDHSLFRLEKGCVGFLKVSAADKDGAKRARELYAPAELAVNCPGCKLHN